MQHVTSIIFQHILVIVEARCSQVVVIAKPPCLLEKVAHLANPVIPRLVTLFGRPVSAIPCAELCDMLQQTCGLRS